MEYENANETNNDGVLTYGDVEMKNLLYLNVIR